MAMGSGTEKESQSDHLNLRVYFDLIRKLSESIQEANSMTQHNNEILEALRRIRQDTSLSLDSTRTAIDDILSTV